MRLCQRFAHVGTCIQGNPSIVDTLHCVPGKVSCIQWDPSIVDTLGTW